MNILYLGPESKLIRYLLSVGNTVFATMDRITSAKGYDCIVSYGYRHRITTTMINDVGGNAINLHISYLPWNRGVSPNYWSWYDDTPKGVTIHYVDEDYDTGDIIVQRYTDLNSKITLRESYQVLSDDIEDLFITNWHHMFSLPRIKQNGNGSVHHQNDPLCLPYDWETTGEMVRNVKTKHGAPKCRCDSHPHCIGCYTEGR